MDMSQGYRIEAHEPKENEWLPLCNRDGVMVYYTTKEQAEAYVKRFVSDDIQTRIVHCVF